MATRKTRKQSLPPSRQQQPEPVRPKDSARLQELRRKIDAVDQRLVRLLNERASLVVEVGKSKRAEGTPIYAPHREAEVLRKVLSSNKGPLSDRAVEGIYRELMSGSFALEQPLRIGYLGPPGSNSHAAAFKQFGSSVDYEDLREIGGVFTEVRRGHVNYGLVPIENSLGGGIVETLDAFKANAQHISVYGEVQIAVHHALLANCQPSQVRRIHSKPEIFQQCRNWLSTQYPGVELMPAASSSRAAQIAADECRKALEIGAEPGSAAIGTALAGQLYGLNVLFPRIEDDPNNITRFVIIARQNARPTGDDKTSLMFTTDDKPGALVSVLGVFQSAGINLSHIDKRPQGRERWTYTFFVDALGHREDPAMVAAIEQAQTHCRELFVLGSYPRSRRIL
ncbi:chorismate mutase [Archangium gephyra]|uniref:Bifunctional chorismate mutase/prephenate dehydratase n=1 Tax=Archangium gephyra TaxID=48 RepID=A0AAC8Q8S9_9BACT|nr:chorismate mutase [Archangium gephyra]AKJ02661.1 Chorismate mutase I [Archangium gephyra]REG23206.1 chorismate mutase [Archangium gephyra]